MMGLLGLRTVMACVICVTSVASHNISKPFFFTWHWHGLMSFAVGHVWGGFDCPLIICAISSRSVNVPIATFDDTDIFANPTVDVDFRFFDVNGISLAVSRYSDIASRWMYLMVAVAELSGMRKENLKLMR